MSVFLMEMYIVNIIREDVNVKKNNENIIIKKKSRK